MARGGARPGAGRPPGSLNKKTQELAAKLMEEGLTPLEYMLREMRNESNDKMFRGDMAKSAAPYVHPKLANIEFKGNIQLSHEIALAELD